MFRAFLVKEIRNHLLSFRFLAVFVLLLIIVPVTVLILSTDAVRKQDEYSRRQAEIQAATSATTPTSTGSIRSSPRPSRPSPCWPSSGDWPTKST
ncbi:MAG: hypothetical protein MZV63_65085 [Marinilabiliales bacterium]|nr:hypothetical protein [Marinilabiliales bacterium]